MIEEVLIYCWLSKECVWVILDQIPILVMAIIISKSIHDIFDSLF